MKLRAIDEEMEMYLNQDECELPEDLHSFNLKMCKMLRDCVWHVFIFLRLLCNRHFTK
jgi:hypothetical protein